jgi:hypothetical protein
MPTRSAAFERFRFSFFEDPDSARQGLDTPALAGLAGEERERAEGMLIAFLPDSRAIIGLGVLGLPKAEPHLVALFEAERSAQQASKLRPEANWLPYRLLHLATALWRIRPDPRWPLAAIDVLGSATEPVERRRRCTMFAIPPPFRRSSKLSTTRYRWCATMLRAGCLRSTVCPPTPRTRSTCSIG